MSITTTRDTLTGAKRSRVRFDPRSLARARTPLMLSVPVLLALVAGYFYLTAGRFVSTEDSYVTADMVSVSADVSGRIVLVSVARNQPVKAGQELYRLDDRPFRIALERAQAQLAAARLQIDGLRANYRQKLADIQAAEDTLAYQQREFDRQTKLLAGHVTTQSKYDEARHNLDTARQQLASMEQQKANTLASLDNNPDIATDQHPLVMQAQAQVDQAALDLSHTVIVAPSDGIVSQTDMLQIGNYLAASTPAFSLVSGDHVWVEANFKETDIAHMRPGQSATVDVDAYSDRGCTGRVDSVAAGAGSAFSVLPAQNATGNWVKVVQRIPVRLAVDCGKDRPLRAGMSANVEVDTRWRRPLVAKVVSLFDWIFGARAENGAGPA